MQHVNEHGMTLEEKNALEVIDFLARAALRAYPDYIKADLQGDVLWRPSLDYEVCFYVANRLGIMDRMHMRLRALRRAAR